MLIQMLYGIWTNSLGLISDGDFFSCSFHANASEILKAIHMAFDCMAIAVGLFASIMATWAPNERFTYGLVHSATVYTPHNLLCLDTGALKRYRVLLMEYS